MFVDVSSVSVSGLGTSCWRLSNYSAAHAGKLEKIRMSQSTDHDLRVFYGRWSVCEVSIEDYSNYRSTLGPLNEEAALMYCRVQANWWLDAPGLWPGPVEDGSPPHSNHSLDAALEKKNEFSMRMFEAKQMPCYRRKRHVCCSLLWEETAKWFLRKYAYVYTHIFVLYIYISVYAVYVFACAYCIHANCCL